MGVNLKNVVLAIMSWEGNLLVKYLMGKCTSDEKNNVELWIKESPYNLNTLNHLKSVVNPKF